MARILLLVPSGHDVGLTSVSLGLYGSLHREGRKVGFFKPISQTHKEGDGVEQSVLAIKNLNPSISIPEPIRLKEAESLLRHGNEEVLMERVVDNLHSIKSDVDVIVAEGLVSASSIFFAKRLNNMLAKALDAEVILVGAPYQKTPEELAEAFEIESKDFVRLKNFAGCVINKIGRVSESLYHKKIILPHTKAHHYGRAASEEVDAELLNSYRSAVEQAHLPVLGTIPWSQDLVNPKLEDIAEHVNAHFLRPDSQRNRRIQTLSVCTMSLSKSLFHLQDDTLVITTGDRADIVLGVAMAYLSGVNIGGLLLCGGFEPDANVMILCEKAFSAGLPLLTTSSDIYQTCAGLSDMQIEVKANDSVKLDKLIENVGQSFSSDWFKNLLASKREHRMSPPEFRSLLIRLSKGERKKIILPEGEEERTLQAALICAKRGIADIVLLGNPEVIMKSVLKLGLEWHPSVEIMDPHVIAPMYIEPLVELRKHKGMTPEKAVTTLDDTITLGTMMLKLDEVDGLVAGAVNTSAATVRPALQLIKTAPDADLISSIFFMGLPNQILVFGDCAINQDPTASELAQIAIQSADSAQKFGIPPRVAMISYSTGNSGTGADVEKVKEATKLVKELRPDLLVDGPLQYDAAMIEAVAQSKAPDSPVAGRATVLIFPDLNTGNTTYKAVQRSSGGVSIGPMLQGLAKPVNDLSRGALVEDIVYTIALTAIQAQ